MYVFITHCIHTIGRRDYKSTLDNIMMENYRWYVLKWQQMGLLLCLDGQHLTSYTSLWNLSELVTFGVYIYLYTYA